MSSTSPETLTGQATDDDVEESHDAVDDGFEDCCYRVNDGHYALADGTEDGLDAGYDRTHFERIRRYVSLKARR